MESSVQRDIFTCACAQQYLRIILIKEKNLIHNTNT